MTTRCEVIGDATLYLGNCLEVMANLEAVDHIMGDPPYEDELHEASAAKRIKRTDGGSELPGDLGFAGINRVRADVSRAVASLSQGWVLLFTLAEGVRAWRDDLQAAGAKWDTTLAWVKPDAMPRFNGQGAARGFECAVTCWCGKGYRSWNGGGRKGVFTHARGTDRSGAHPTEKPVELMQELVTLYTNPGQTVLDPFMGSGTTGVACLRLGRKFIGIEINPAHFETSLKRLQEAERQPRLFEQPKLVQAAFDLGAAS